MQTVEGWGVERMSALQLQGMGAPKEEGMGDGKLGNDSFLKKGERAI